MLLNGLRAVFSSPQGSPLCLSTSIFAMPFFVFLLAAALKNFDDKSVSLSEKLRITLFIIPAFRVFVKVYFFFAKK